ncbi:MAG: Fic family protein [Eubacterium sp.]|nr:Fic family protein [Eubacterium sp.]
MRRFDYYFLKNEVPGNIIGLTGIISDLRTREEVRKMQYSDTFESLRMKALIESVRGSNAIEGIVSTDSRIREIVGGAAPVTHVEKEISGYRDALGLIHQNHDELDITEDVIVMLHRMIEEQTDKEEAGKYKKNDNLIMEYDSDGKRYVRFRPVPAAEVKTSMEQLLLAYYDARQDSEISPLLLIPCFILDFSCIHPFTDGNGRVSRLLAVLLLYMAGYDIVRYISFEEQINKHRDAYYEALKESSYQWHDNSNDYVPFIVNFLQTLYACFKQLDDSFIGISLKKASKSERVENVLSNAIVPVSKQDILDRLPDVSVKTVELVLSRMLKEGRIKKIGTFRDARYMRN